MRLLFSSATFLSAFLLFSIEPFLAKLALPVFGGGPGIWDVSLAFSQCALLTGYAYADRLKLRWSRWQLLALAVGGAFLPIRLEGQPAWAAAHPGAALLVVLALSAGLPFVVLSANGPLLQTWYAAAGSGDPYWLYAASNAGSLAALLAYPFAIEPVLGLRAQGQAWAWGYVLCVILVACCAWRASVTLARIAPEMGKARRARQTRIIGRSWEWAVWAALPAALSLAVSNFLSNEVAPLPFVWTLPLAVYLATLALAFAPGQPSARLWGPKALPWALLLWAGAMGLNIEHPLWLVLAIHLGVMLVVGWSCHAELWSRKPEPERLTRFYMWTAAGGAAGGLLVAFGAPLLFKSYAEYPLLLTIAVALSWRAWPRALAGLCAVALGLVLLAGSDLWPHLGLLYGQRDFFGTIRVVEDSTHQVHLLTNGNTIHGTEIFTPAMQGRPLAYYDEGGPAGQLMGVLRARLGRQPARVAVIGLGAGTMAAYARPGDNWTFYELDPNIRAMAYNYRLFTFMMGCGPFCHVVVGDGRLALAGVPDNSLDAIVVDAFGSDAIPTHLLTREALELYVSKLKPHGWIAFHVTSRHFDIAPLLGAMAQKAGLAALAQQRPVNDSLIAWGVMASAWVAVARRVSDIAQPGPAMKWQPAPVGRGLRPWSDDYSSPLDILLTR